MWRDPNDWENDDYVMNQKLTPISAKVNLLPTRKARRKKKKK